MSKKKDLSPALKAECDAAKALFTSRKNALGLTQAKIAEAADISPAAVAMYLNGQNPLNAKFAAVLSRLIGEPVEKFSPRLATELKQMQSAPSSQNAGAADKVRQMLDKVGKSLTDDARQQIIRAASEGADHGNSNVITGDFRRTGMVGDEIRIAHYDVQGAMGNGKLVHDFPEMFRDVTVSQQHLKELGVKYQDPAHLKLITGDGQSMEPTIQDKDPLIADASIREFTGDGIYAFVWQGLFYIKRLQIKDSDHFKMISDNKHHDPEIIRIDETYIQARILLVWNAQKL
ncbi:Helix-turn-helix [Pseudomonas guineae]|uniref:Helix-turn-helix n=1 Tax=Pseudomonas guineae TaxID=425504 RepID=A0A1I3KCB5_9PSED|nr:LexA family transcriptional regulator [Pseudomonas guineae]SFI70149.1 Helix-turn-helix [Pseudomonas guineae]